MRRFIIGDTHWGHSMIQKHCRRPPDVDKLICRNWIRLVQEEDLVIHLGDVAFNFVKLKGLLDGLPGRKVLVLGNHDSHTITWYMANGFEFACDGLRMGQVYFSHRP